MFCAPSMCLQVEVFQNTSVRGVCSLFGSVLQEQKFEEMDGPVLQLSFIQQAKDSTPSTHEGGPTSKERPQSVLASSFYKFVSSPHS